MTADAATLDIRSIGAQGDGVAELDGAVVHVPRALPGEHFRQTAHGAYILDGQPSRQRRVAPLCPHFPLCGGCQLQHMDEALYRGWKSGLLAQALAQRGITLQPEPMVSVPHNSRRRATFTAALHDGFLRLGYHGPASSVIEPIVACAVLAPRIVEALPPLRDLAALILTKTDELRISVLAADNGLDVSVAGRHASLTASIRARLAQASQAAGVIRLTIGDEPLFLNARPHVAIGNVDVLPTPGAFLQATAEAEEAMIRLATTAVKKAKRVADLFCGIGTFSLALAKSARVLAVDSDRTLIEALTSSQRNARGLKPVDARVRDLFRDPLSPRELDGMDAVLIDPPRAGAKAQVEALARSKVGTVVAVSCNPATLARDLRTLLDGGYRIESAVAIDQFLYSAHLEAVVILRR
jgi:23S rRNA (uracil1939-C5)-methyltransferase